MSKSIIRHYSVVLSPEDGVEYDPLEVTLHYTDEQAAKLDPKSLDAITEAARRAVKVERRDHLTPDERVFTIGEVCFLRERLSTVRR